MACGHIHEGAVASCACPSWCECKKPRPVIAGAFHVPQLDEGAYVVGAMLKEPIAYETTPRPWPETPAAFVIHAPALTPPRAPAREGELTFYEVREFLRAKVREHHRLRGVKTMLQCPCGEGDGTQIGGHGTPACEHLVRMLFHLDRVVAEISHHEWAESQPDYDPNYKPQSDE